MTDTFNSLIKKPWVGVRFLLKIQGIGDVFLDGPIPTKQDGTAWAALPSNGPAAFTYREYMLDLGGSGGGLQDIGQQVTRSEGHTAPGQMSITLMDDRLGYLRDLFATDPDFMASARLSDATDLDYDTTGAGTVVTCDDTITGWDATGYAYLGRETIYYPVISGADFGTAGNKTNRDVYSLGGSDTSYTPGANQNKAPRVITSKPTVWHGRYLQLFAYLVDREGRALADDLDTLSREVFRGVIQGPPIPDQSYSRYLVNARSIDSVLHTSVGLEPVEGSLVRVIGTSKEDAAGNKFDFAGGQDFVSAFYITESTRYLTITLDTPLATDHFKIALFPAGTVVSGVDEMIQAFNVTATDTIQADADWSDVRLRLFTEPGTSKKKGTYQLWAISSDADHAYKVAGVAGGGTNLLTVTVSWEAEGSIGPLLGFTGTDSAPITYTPSFPSSEWYETDGDAFVDLATSDNTDTYLAAVIGPYDTSIPFFYKSNFGLFGQDAAASGHVRIGDEVIEYEAIETPTGNPLFVDGMRLLTGCTRGVAGVPKEHRVEYSASGEAVAEAVDIKFIQYFDGISFLDVIRQLAISTGEATHHGVYDTLDQFVGPAIADDHFDHISFDVIKESLADEDHLITWWFDKPENLVDLAAKWLTPLGLFITARTNADGDYKIAIVENLPPLQAEYHQALDQSNISATSPASWQSLDQIINEVVIRYRWDPAEGDNTEDYVVVRDTDSITDYGTKGRQEWDLIGYQLSYEQAIAKAHQWAVAAFARFGRPSDLLEIETDRAGWLCRPGDIILISMAGPPNRDTGGRVYNTRAVRVLGAAYRYHAPGGQPGAKLSVILEDVQRYASYAPSAGVRSAVGVTLTIDSDSYSTTGDSVDIDHFDEGDRVKIFNKGDEASGSVDEREIVSISGTTVTLDSGLTNVTAGATTVMVASQWSNANLNLTQRDHAYIADLSVVGSYTNTTPFKYV